jgi:hypothetical protein
MGHEPIVLIRRCAAIGAIQGRGRHQPRRSAGTERAGRRAKRLRRGDFSEAAEGTRTLDLLHGNRSQGRSGILS